MNGKRVPWPAGAYPADVTAALSPGDYAGPWRGLWLVCAPSGEVGSLRPENHHVWEHEDGTISVQPSLDFRTADPSIRPSWKPADYDETHAFDLLSMRTYHGFLKRGVWSAV